MALPAAGYFTNPARTNAEAKQGQDDMRDVVAGHDTAIAGKMTDPTTTRGDLIYRGADAPARLAKGAAGQFLTQGADDPAWGNALPADAASVTYTDAHTLTASDRGKIVYMNKGTAVTLTVPKAATEDLPDGFQVTVVNLGAGQVTVAVEAGDTLNKPATKTAKLAEQHAIAVVWKRTDGQWHIDGNLEAA
jgi:hypothetical protein